MICRIEQGIFGRFYLAHPTEPGRAWSGLRWVAHEQGLPIGGVQVCNFNRAQAAEYAKAEGFDVQPLCLPDGELTDWRDDGGSGA